MASVVDYMTKCSSQGKNALLFFAFLGEIKNGKVVIKGESCMDIQKFLEKCACKGQMIVGVYNDATINKATFACEG